ncbi:MAG: universal stress protein [Chloroflexi bacterium]|nr:universal stress protein [Chloroflexota bacterium]
MPVDASHASMQAVALACDIARQNKGKVVAVHVIEVKRTLALDAPMEPEEAAGEEILKRAEGVAKTQSCSIESEILHAREAGSAIVDEAIDRQVDLVILGTGYEQPFGAFQLSSIVLHVLKNAPCEVWVCRHPAEGVR